MRDVPTERTTTTLALLLLLLLLWLLLQGLCGARGAASLQCRTVKMRRSIKKIERSQITNGARTL